MAKKFSITGTCIPSRHYLADTLAKLKRSKYIITAMSIYPLFAAIPFLLFQCLPATAQQPVMVSYTPSAADFVNPERGFMRFTETTSGDYIPLSSNQMASWRSLHLPGGDPAADYAIYASLVYRGFYLESFTNGPISTAYLSAMQEDFDAARLAGVKLIVRFAYTQKTTASLFKNGFNPC
ncbi:MAG: DUF4874 domain-containing protein [Saprospiraceae bacterium]|nr:DUF4874 domain-containing protein [Saprospiraceae bacterium]